MGNLVAFAVLHLGSKDSGDKPSLALEQETFHSARSTGDTGEFDDAFAGAASAAPEVSLQTTRILFGIFSISACTVRSPLVFA